MVDVGVALPSESSVPVRIPFGRIFLRDLGFGVSAWALVAAIVAWQSWHGDLLHGLMIGFLAFVIGIPSVLLIWAASLFSDRPSAVIVKRIALQSFIVGMLSISLPFFGFWVEGLSIRASQHRGDRIVTALEAYRRAHGTYPKSLAALEEHAKVGLPRPTMSPGFIYELSSDGRSFQLMFDDGRWRPWILDSDSPRWTKLD